MKKSLKSMLVLSLLVFFCAYGVQSIAAKEKQIKQSECTYYTQLSGNLVKDNITIQKYSRPMLTQWTLEPDSSVFDRYGKAIFVLAPMSESATPTPEMMPLPTLTPVMGATPTPGDEEMFESGDDYDFDEALTTPTPLTFRYFGMATPSPKATMYQFEGAFPTPAPTPAPKAEYSLSQFTTALPDFGYSSPLPLRMMSPRPTPTMSRAQERRRLIMPTATPRHMASPTPRPMPNITATPGEEYAPLSQLIQLTSPVPETPSQPENEQLFFENPTTPSPGGAPYIYGLPTMSPSPGFLFPNGGNGYGNGNGNGNMKNLSPGFWKPTMTPMVKPTVTPMSLY